MAKIELVGIDHTYRTGREETHALKDVNLVFEDGVAGALLGPSGCGKTTLLNIISGLLRPTKGRVVFNGKDVTDLPTERRQIAQVFQFPVVYDSMTVYGNLAFPLRNRHLPVDVIDKRVKEIAGMLDLDKHLHSGARTLGPGERQAIALGRGIVRDDTNIVLLDEPMTQIDPGRRWFLRRDLNIAQHDLGLTMIYVTHDQYEALTFAQKVVVMKDGLVVQVGSPGELYENPAAPFVGFFIGSPGMNILDVVIADGQFKFADFSLPAPAKAIQEMGKKGKNLQVGIRPENLEYSQERKAGLAPFEVSVIENMGDHQIFTLKSRSTTLKGRAASQVSVSKGQTLWVGFKERGVKVYQEEKLVWFSQEERSARR